MVHICAVLLSSFVVASVLSFSVCGYRWLPRIAFVSQHYNDCYLNLSVVFCTSITGPRIARKLGSMIEFSSSNITRKFHYSEHQNVQ